MYPPAPRTGPGLPRFTFRRTTRFWDARIVRVPPTARREGACPSLAVGDHAGTLHGPAPPPGPAAVSGQQEARIQMRDGRTDGTDHTPQSSTHAPAAPLCFNSCSFLLYFILSNINIIKSVIRSLVTDGRPAYGPLGVHTRARRDTDDGRGTRTGRGMDNNNSLAVNLSTTSSSRRPTATHTATANRLTPDAGAASASAPAEGSACYGFNPFPPGPKRDCGRYACRDLNVLRRIFSGSYGDVKTMRVTFTTNMWRPPQIRLFRI